MTWHIVISRRHDVSGTHRPLLRPAWPRRARWYSTWFSISACTRTDSVSNPVYRQTAHTLMKRLTKSSSRAQCGRPVRWWCCLTCQTDVAKYKYIYIYIYTSNVQCHRSTGPTIWRSGSAGRDLSVATDVTDEEQSIHGEWNRSVGTWHVICWMPIVTSWVARSHGYRARLARIISWVERQHETQYSLWYYCKNHGGLKSLDISGVDRVEGGARFDIIVDLHWYIATQSSIVWRDKLTFLILSRKSPIKYKASATNGWSR